MCWPIHFIYIHIYIYIDMYITKSGHNVFTDVLAPYCARSSPDTLLSRNYNMFLLGLPVRYNFILISKYPDDVKITDEIFRNPMSFIVLITELILVFDPIIMLSNLLSSPFFSDSYFNIFLGRGLRLRLRQYGSHFPVFVNENSINLIQISLEFVSKLEIDNKTTLVQNLLSVGLINKSAHGHVYSFFMHLSNHYEKFQYKECSLLFDIHPFL